MVPLSLSRDMALPGLAFEAGAGGPAILLSRRAAVGKRSSGCPQCMSPGNWGSTIYRGPSLMHVAAELIPSGRPFGP